MKEVSILSIIKEIKKESLSGWNLENDYNSEFICNLDMLLNEDGEEEGGKLYE